MEVEVWGAAPLQLRESYSNIPIQTHGRRGGLLGHSLYRAAVVSGEEEVH